MMLHSLVPHFSVHPSSACLSVHVCMCIQYTDRRHVTDKQWTTAQGGRYLWEKNSRGAVHIHQCTSITPPYWLIRLATIYTFCIYIYISVYNSNNRTSRSPGFMEQTTESKSRALPVSPGLSKVFLFSPFFFPFFAKLNRFSFCFFFSQPDTKAPTPVIH